MYVFVIFIKYTEYWYNSTPFATDSYILLRELKSQQPKNRWSVAVKGHRRTTLITTFFK